MDGREVQAALDRLWAAPIQELHFEPLGNRISFGIRMIEEDSWHEHSLVFEDVASFRYMHDDGERRLNLWPLEPGACLELSNAWYEPDGVGHIVVQSGSGPWTERWWSSANFYILLWNHILLVEAGRVVVDGQAFEVGYPPASLHPPAAIARRRGAHLPAVCARAVKGLVEGAGRLFSRTRR